MSPALNELSFKQVQLWMIPALNESSFGQVQLQMSPVTNKFSFKQVQLQTQLCPSCKQEPEDEWHFLEYTHKTHQTLFNKLKSNLMQLTQKLQLHPCLLTALWIGLLAIHSDTKYPDIYVDVPQTLQWPLQAQEQLGWDQLYYGCPSIIWAEQSTPSIQTFH